jgi:hypothetical protein
MAVELERVRTIFYEYFITYFKCWLTSI